ncbi:MAG: gfo/Idh/MocA family oxidoreductase, partial [Candidatus Makaraimicrobium thalassicum]
MTEKFISLIGLGYWGKNILRNLHELGVLYSAFDNNQQTIAQMQSRFPEVRFSSSVEEIMENSEIKAVAIATPAITHYNLGKQALEAGKDVFVEKPLALTTKDGE